LTPDDTKALIEYRLLAAGRDSRQAPLFMDDSIVPIWQETRGYPRSICFLCLHLCLELLHKNGTQVNKDFVASFLEEHPHYRRLRSDGGNG
jgi:type II secretory pathway predicted ATPase ExeA